MSDLGLNLNDVLALDRTRMAAERTLMAWVRTALSMITFGFTIYKFLDALQDESTVPVLRPNTPRNLGLILIGIGTFAVIAASVQHWTYMKKLNQAPSGAQWDLAFMVASLIAILGLVMFWSILLRSGPLS
jgi:putative membrane protein